MTTPSRLLLLALISALLVPAALAQKKVVKVFILAGQSNMEGKAPNALFEHQANDAKTKEIFAHLRDDDGWVARDDVFINYLKRRGPLTIGYGSRDRTGVELDFGHTMGDHYKEPVLLIKACWGGHSLVQKFRSPSAGLPDTLEKELADARKRVEQQNKKENQDRPLPTMDDIKSQYGSSYRSMMAEVQATQENYTKWFPALKGHAFEIAGFVWFQGWNDQYGGAENHYADNMAHFIRDVRKDLAVPDMPFVIGVMGQNGSEPAKGAMKTIRDAQLSMQKTKGFRGNVVAVRTDVLIDKAAEKLYPDWRENFEEWKLVGGDFAYHYLGSAIWFTRMGRAFGNAMIKLIN